MSYQLIQRRLPVFAFHWSRIHTSTKAVAQKIPEARFISPYHDHVRLFSTSPLTPTNHEELLKHLHHHHHHHSIIRRRTRSNQRPFSTFGNRPPIVTFDKNNPKDPNEFFIQENDDIRHILHETNLGCMTSKQIAHAKSLIHDLSNLRTFQGAHLAEEILERLYAEGVDGGNRQVQQQLEPKLYNIIIDAYGKSGQGSGVDKAEALMERMKERSRVSIDLGNNEKDVFMTGPDLFSYNSLLNAWSLSKREDAVTKVEKIVEFLESSSNSSRSSSSSSSSSSNDVVKPNSVTYNIMMNTYANQVGEYGYAQKAEDILLHMTSLQKDGNEAIHPDTTSFNIVLKAWKNSGGGVESAKRAEEILRLMVKLYVDGHHDLKPDHVSFRTVIHAYMKHGEDGKLSNEIVDRIQGIGELVLDDGIDYFSDNPDIVSNVISEVLMCLAKSGAVDVGKRAKNLFDKLNQARDTNEHVHVGKEEETYVNTIIALLSDPKTANLGHDMMQNMLEGNSSILPRTQDLNRILHLYCQNQNVAAAQDLYLTMLRLAKTQGFETMPDIATYNMMANLCFQSNDDSSFPLALMVLDQMEEDYKTGLLSNLSDFVYKIVIHKLTKSKLPTSQGANAYDVLMRMINSYDNGGLEREPETVLFNMVLSSIMNQSMENKAEKALVSYNLWQVYEKNVSKC
jgi:pentatricopeptide repeat protein